MKIEKLMSSLRNSDPEDFVLMARLVTELNDEEQSLFQLAAKQKLNSIVNEDDLAILKEESSLGGLNSLKNISLDQYRLIIMRYIFKIKEIEQEFEEQYMELSKLTPNSETGPASIIELYKRIYIETFYSYLTSYSKVDLNEVLQIIVNIKELESIDKLDSLDSKIVEQALVTYALKDITSNEMRKLISVAFYDNIIPSSDVFLLKRSLDKFTFSEQSYYVLYEKIISGRHKELAPWVMNELYLSLIEDKVINNDNIQNLFKNIFRIRFGYAEYIYNFLFNSNVLNTENILEVIEFLGNSKFTYEFSKAVKHKELDNKHNFDGVDGIVINQILSLSSEPSSSAGLHNTGYAKPEEFISNLIHERFILLNSSTKNDEKQNLFRKILELTKALNLIKNDPDKFDDNIFNKAQRTHYFDHSQRASVEQIIFFQDNNEDTHTSLFKYSNPYESKTAMLRRNINSILKEELEKFISNSGLYYDDILSDKETQNFSTAQEKINVIVTRNMFIINSFLEILSDKINTKLADYYEDFAADDVAKISKKVLSQLDNVQLDDIKEQFANLIKHETTSLLKEREELIKDDTKPQNEKQESLSILDEKIKFLEDKESNNSEIIDWLSELNKCCIFDGNGLKNRQRPKS